MPSVTCLDLEGVLTPEVWISVAEKTGIEKLRLTTRDISDYDELMRMRLGLLDQNGLKLADIQAVIRTLEPLEGAKEFLDRLRGLCQVIILSDTYYEFAGPLMEKLGRPVELVYYDDQTMPANVPAIYTKLIDVDKVDLLLGPYATNMIAAAIPVIAQRKLTTISMLGLAVNSQFHYKGYFSMLTVLKYSVPVGLGR